MNDFHSLSHTTWDCKYHLIWIPKYRKKVLFESLRKYLGDVLKEYESY
jgi:putative transposase